MAELVPEEHRVTLFTFQRLGERSVLDGLLDTLAGAGLTPTHAGRDRRTKEPFDRKRLVADVTGGKLPLFVLSRTKAPRLLLTGRAQPSGIVAVAAELPGKLKDPSLPYQLGDRLAEQLAAVHGVVHPSYPNKGDFNMAGSINSAWLQDFGPLPPAARTWYGEHVVRLLGKSLAAAGGEQVETGWGAVRFDLVAEPWTASFRALSRRQQEAIAALTPAGVLGDYSHAVKYAPGARWKPIPEPS